MMITMIRDVLTSTPGVRSGPGWVSVSRTLSLWRTPAGDDDDDNYDHDDDNNVHDTPKGDDDDDVMMKMR